MRIERHGLIISPASCPSIGTNINGPSLVRAPDWCASSLGKYLLYFADHKGSFIRLAAADELSGPWRVHRPGSLALSDSGFPTEPFDLSPEQRADVAERYERALGPGHDIDQMVVDATVPHIASPDVHVDTHAERFVMYFHGLASLGVQETRVAVSTDGVRFDALPETIGAPYLRRFDYGGCCYAITMPGRFQRSADGLTEWEAGPALFDRSMRHAAVVVRGDTLHVFWTRVGDAPESILHSTVDLCADWMAWEAIGDDAVLRPEHDWEGADAPTVPSKRSTAPHHVNQLRDPDVFVDIDGTTWLTYAVAGESGIALARIEW